MRRKGLKGRVIKTLACIFTLATMLSTTALAGPSDTYYCRPVEEFAGENADQLLEGVDPTDIYSMNYGGYQVDHYHGDTVSVILYEFQQNDVSLAGNEGIYSFNCTDGKFMKVDGTISTATEEWPEFLGFVFNNMDDPIVGDIDGNSIHAREFSIKPGTYVFGTITSVGSVNSYGYSIALNRDLTPAGYDENGYEIDTPVTVEAGDVVRVYLFHQAYVYGDATNGFKEEDLAWREEYLPKFQEWAAENEKKASEEQSAMQQTSEEVISVEPSAEPSAQPDDAPVEESTPVPSESPAIAPVSPSPAPEEKSGSKTGIFVGGGIALLVLIVLGFVIGRKK